MSQIPIVQGIRVLTSEQIQALSAGNFRLYRNKVYRTRDGFGRRSYDCENEPLSDREIKDLRALDYLFHEIARDKARRRKLASRG